MNKMIRIELKKCPNEYYKEQFRKLFLATSCVGKGGENETQKLVYLKQIEEGGFLMSTDGKRLALSYFDDISFLKRGVGDNTLELSEFYQVLKNTKTCIELLPVKHEGLFPQFNRIVRDENDYCLEIENITSEDDINIAIVKLNLLADNPCAVVATEHIKPLVDSGFGRFTVSAVRNINNPFIFMAGDDSLYIVMPKGTHRDQIINGTQDLCRIKDLLK
jgi:hypothetical protein